MPIKIISIVIQADTEQAAAATARRIVNTMDNVAAWANTNQAGLVSSIKATTKDIAVTTTAANYSKNAGGTLVAS